MKRLIIGAVASFACLIHAPASAALLVGGQTNVEVTAPLSALGITPGLLGGELVSTDPLTLGFGVTGGELDFTTLGGTIEHVGASISLTGDLGTADESDDVTVILSDFLIDTNNAILSGDVNGGGMVDLFSLNFAGLDAAAITDLNNPQIALTFLDGASGLLETVFQLDSGILSGAQFGLAATSPIPAEVSAPASIGLLGASLLGFGMYRRLKK
ncbi:hypothetical protein PN836_007060 [Ningiella sp. W23]|uniref:hypothetical protein n=1 Tax=Ningiella sp. W23 TaxID=3023715 RepID=UPI0037569BA2